VRIPFCLALVASISASPGFAFENIEADVAYQREIKEQIEKDFLHGLTLLKRQADSLDTEVREKDLLILQHHMYGKAILLGRCIDEAFRLKKVFGQSNLDVPKYTQACEKAHTEFVSWLHSEKVPERLKISKIPDLHRQISRDRALDSAFISDPFQKCIISTGFISYNNENKPYDFLKLDAFTLFSWPIEDYFNQKACFEKEPKFPHALKLPQTKRSTSEVTRIPKDDVRPVCLRPNGC
jgi:hypothetical protein